MNHRHACIALLSLPLVGCISLGAKPPEALLTLTSATPIAVGTQQNSATQRAIIVQVPTVPTALATTRVPVQATPTTIAYVKNAAWAEPPARLFARLLADSMTTRASLVVLPGVQSLSDPSSVLGGELRMFGLDAATSTAVVTYDAVLVRAGQTTVEKRRFEARVPVTAVAGTTAGVAINDAANQVVAQVADWVRTR